MAPRETPGDPVNHLNYLVKRVGFRPLMERGFTVIRRVNMKRPGVDWPSSFGFIKKKKKFEHWVRLAILRVMANEVADTCVPKRLSRYKNPTSSHPSLAAAPSHPTLS